MEVAEKLPEKIYLEDEPFHCEGFDVHWTGWKTARDNARVVGQWLAWGAVQIYASVPGGEGYYRKGQPFDIMARAPQEILEVPTPENIKESEKAKGRERIIRLIDAHNQRS